jgi:DNA-binding MarR family transcriptional regulator
MYQQPSPTPSANTVALLETTRRLERRLSDSVDGALEDLALTSSQYLVLEALDAEPRIHASQVARALRITRRSAHALIVKLRYADMVELLPLDLGVRGLMLTDVGSRRLIAAREAIEHELSPIDAELEADDLVRMLDLMDAAAHALRPRPPPWWFG